ncbi:PREDICTED: speckle-type POZ protein-like [Rhagoletis zephyria]|uniref:speckle-type POZ protein-like n=1 Tax=Rhagoletis zephyria TaxID=28612 RepID=UPI0008117D56|nr:PREDICTED: speckle-type POZ protein-like [Rhagoletis zephyria]
MFAFGSDKFVKFSEISNKRKKLLPDNQLQIAFDAKVNYNRIDCGSNESFLVTSLTTGSFETDMNQLLLDNIHSDFDLIVDDKRLHLHKSILSAHSPYFNNMFKENPSITEFNLAGKDYLYHILRILYFMYTGEVVNFKEVTSHMVVYAKMFQMDEFYQYLQSCLLATIDHSNVIRRLIVAHVAGISVVKANCVAFVKNNFNKVMSTTAWLSLTKECKELVIELNNEIANQC